MTGRRTWLRIPALVLPAAVLSGCGGNQNTLHPASHPEHEISTLFWVVLAASVPAWAIDPDRIESADKNPNDWLTYHGSYRSWHFSLLDQIEDQISAIPFVAEFDDGNRVPVSDLQIFPRGGTISFKVAEPAILRGSR